MTNTLNIKQCEACLAFPPYDQCAALDADESASCAYITQLKRRIAELEGAAIQPDTEADGIVFCGRCGARKG